MTPPLMTDKTNFGQSLMHMIKGNLGTGILAMPTSFAHSGLIYAVLGLPGLCIVATYCVHLLVRSSQHLEGKFKLFNLEYAELAKGAFKRGPSWVKPSSSVMCRLVDGILIINQLGICCVYVVFVVDSMAKILDTYEIKIENHFYLFIAVLPAFLFLSCIRTLKKLSIASACANVLQAVGICITVQYLIRKLIADGPSQTIEYTKPISEAALGFGSAMFAFEGISVVLPIYTRMKRPEQMGGWSGLINLSYTILLLLYITVGLLGYLAYGSEAGASITLNLPKEPLYDIVRAIFLLSLLLTYPLQLYVPCEIIWNSIKSKLSTTEKTTPTPNENLKYFEYLCRIVLVLITFIMAFTIPQLNLMMDFVGSIAGTALSVILPPLIHIVAFWEDTSGTSKAFLVIVDILLITIGILASFSGSYFSLIGILQSFKNNGTNIHH